MKKISSLLWWILVVVLATCSYTLAFTQEQQEAYQWAYKYGLTTQPTIEAANLNWNITRQAFSKMIVNYLENVVWVKQIVKNSCSFPDENKITNDLKVYAKKTCSYDIMWSNGKSFNPTQFVSRAQLWTVLSRILWWDKYNSTGKWYYIYHLNALKDYGIMKNINNPTWSYAKRWDVLIMLKRTYEKFGSNIYMNNWSQTSSDTRTSSTSSIEVSDNTSIVNHYNDDDYISNIYSNSNVIYTWKNGKKYYYDDKFLNLLKDTAEEKWEWDLAKYLLIEAEYFKNGLDQLSNLDSDELPEMLWIDLDNLDPGNMTKQEKEEFIKKFKKWFGKIIDESKEKNKKFLDDLNKVLKNIKKDKFWLQDKYNETKTFMEASNEFLDLYSEMMFGLMETVLTSEDEGNNEEWMAQAFGLIWAALAYQASAQKYQTYVEEWAVTTIKSLWGKLDESNAANYSDWSQKNPSSTQKVSASQMRARDVERKTHLSQIQSAVVTSQQDKWMWPWMDKWASEWISVSAIDKELMYAWMSSIPTDPTWNKEVSWLWFAKVVDWGYSYLVTKRNWTSNAWFVLMSKQESAWSSNWVVCKGKSWLENGYITNDTDLKDIKTCSEVKKWNSCSASKCTYTSDDELRYIVIY